jgi:hypothetical protein
MYAIYDTFNNRIVSRHRKIVAAIKADQRLQRSVKRANGATSYLPTELRTIEKDGSTQRLAEDSQEQEQWIYCR